MFIVGADFDGTLVQHLFPEIGEPVPYAFSWLRLYAARGARLILWTMRSDGRSGAGRANGPVLTEAVEFCRAKEVEFWAVNRNPEQHAWTQSPKAYCHVYIDDANACCPLVRPPGLRPYVNCAVVGPHVLALIEANKVEKIHVPEPVHPQPLDASTPEPGQCPAAAGASPERFFFPIPGNVADV